MADSLPDLAAPFPAQQHPHAFSHNTSLAGPHREVDDQAHDDGISPRHSIASAERCPEPADLPSGQDNGPDHHGVYWPIPIKMLASFAFGVIAAGAHSAWYHYLDGNIVKSQKHQENNLRFVISCDFTGIC
jgi:hypothetical protein